MSLYNMLFGTNEKTSVILAMIGIPFENYFERFRDVDLIEDGTKIRVLTRTGGNNREDYTDNWKVIRNNEFYICDYDDDFDNTYAFIEFSIPEKYLEKAKGMFNGEPLSIKEKFEKEIEEMDKPNSEASKRAVKIAEKITKAIENDEHVITF